MPQNAVTACEALDGSIFQGRLLAVKPAKLRKKKKMDASGFDGDFPKSEYQLEKEEKMKQRSEREDFNWNSLFLRSDAVADVTAQKYHMEKGEFLDPSADASLGVRMALAETQLVSETKQMFEDEGVNLGVLSSHNNTKIPRSREVIIVKNLPSFTKKKDIEQLFSPFGGMGRVILAPSNSLGIVEFLQGSEAKTAFRSLAYSKFHHVPLYLEWAPKGIFSSPAPKAKKQTPPPSSSPSPSTSSISNVPSSSPSLSSTAVGNDEKLENELEVEDLMSEEWNQCTLYIKNLNFSTTEDALEKFMGGKKTVRAVKIAKQKKRNVSGGFDELSRGYGFVEFKTKEGALNALKVKQGKELDDHPLQLKFSKPVIGTDEERKKERAREEREKKLEREEEENQKPTSKLMVKNIAFEANKKEVRDLFSPFGNLKSVRLPKKFNGGHRGFGFVFFFLRLILFLSLFLSFFEFLEI